MKSGMKPGQEEPTLSEVNHFLTSKNQQSQNKESALQCQPFVRRRPACLFPCDHIPNDPIWYQPPAHYKPRGKLIQSLIETAKKAYRVPKQLLLSLQQKKEQTKSQRRESAISMLTAILTFVDDVTGRVGIKSDGGRFRDLSIVSLANLCGIRLGRAKRAMRDLVRAGYLTVSRQYKRLATGKIIALTSIRTLTRKFFMELGAGDAWDKWYHNQKWKRQQQMKKEMKHVDKRKCESMLGYLCAESGVKASPGMKRIGGIVKKVTGLAAQKPDVAHHQKDLIATALTMFKGDPSKTVSEYYRELLGQYPPS